MDISTTAVQSYQRHEQPASLAQKAEQTHTPREAASDDPSSADLSVSISDQRTVYQWIANTFNQQLDTTASIRPVTQSLFDYGIIGVEEQKTVNGLSAQNESISILKAIEGRLPSTDSFHEKSTLNTLYRVFSTLDAARMSQ